MIKTENLKKTFDDFTALTDISCTIEKGCIYGMVGSNGAGKSTFIRILNGVYRPDSGVCLIDGEDVYENKNLKERISYVPDTLYFPNGTNLNKMAAMNRNIYERFDMDKYNRLSELFKLDQKKGINTFSKGMKRQAAIILALSTNPDYLFFDETFDGLDPVMRNLVKNIICEDVYDRKATAIITSHSLRELEDLCDQLALLHKGGLVLESDIDNLKTRQFKVQIAFNEDYDINKFKELKIFDYKKNGSVSSFIAKGNKDITISFLSSMNPILLDILPLTLEEIFTYEMETLGYNFNGFKEA